jgi:hypothetical protein
VLVLLKLYLLCRLKLFLLASIVRLQAFLSSDAQLVTGQPEDLDRVPEGIVTLSGGIFEDIDLKSFI